MKFIMDITPTTKVCSLKVLFLVLILATSTKGCERFEQKSKSPVVLHKLVQQMYWQEWIPSYEFPTLYNFTICRNATLEIGKPLEIKNSTTRDIKYIMFQDSTISTVPVGVFFNFLDTKELYLNNSGVETIHPGAFSGMIKLEKIYVQDNKIEVLEKGTLNYLSNLKLLNISRNRLRIIEDNCFLGVTALKKLLLGENRLNQESLSQLNSLVQLETLDLSSNYFQNLEIIQFVNLNNLRRLLVTYNVLDQFSFEAIKNATSLKVLDVSFNNLQNLNFTSIPQTLQLLNFSNNQINYVENWIKLQNIAVVDLRNNYISNVGILGTKINILYLSWNNLSYLNSSTFQNSHELIELDLGHNEIFELDGNVFIDLVKLQILYLNNNQIKYLSIGCFKSLTSLTLLNLSANALVNLEFGTFSGLINLRSLMLDHNNLTIIHENSFHMLQKLSILLLHDNLITSLNPDILLEHLTSLNFITLNNNDWSCNALFNIIKFFRKASVDVPYGESHETANIFGITCNNQDNLDLIKLNAISIDSEDSIDNYDNANFKNTSFYNFFRNFKDSPFYKFFFDLNNSSFYNFFNNDFLNSKFVRYFNSSSRNNNNEETKLTTYSPSVKTTLETFLDQNKDLIQYFKSFSNRVIVFITIMTTTLLTITLLFIFIFLKPNVQKNITPKHYNSFPQNTFELK